MTDDAKPPKPWWRARWNWDRAIRIVTVVTLLALVPLYQQSSEIQDCLTRYASESARSAADVATATAARAQAAAEDRRIEAAEQRATDIVMAAPVREIEQARQDYGRVRAQADAQRLVNEAIRARNPIPSTPTFTCEG